MMLHNCSDRMLRDKAGTEEQGRQTFFYSGNTLLMRMRLFYSTTHLDQETTRHRAVITDAHTLHNRAVEWMKEEIL